MRFQVIDTPQRTPEWLAARLGRLTGSTAAAMLSQGRKKGEPGVGRANLRIRLALERLTGQWQEDTYSNAAMERGVELEPSAFAAYAARTGELAQQTGFLSMVDWQAGCSLDGHVGDFEGIVELKCPNQATHWDYIQGDVVPANYLPQITHNLWVTDALWCDFASFDDRFPEHRRLFIKRVYRKDVDLVAYELAVSLFLSEVDAQVAEIAAQAA